MFMRYEQAFGVISFRPMSHMAEAMQDRAKELKRQLRSLGDRVNRHEMTPAEAKLEFARLEAELALLERKPNATGS
jgi:hypothetical protein